AAVQLSYDSGSASARFAAGTPPHHAQSASVDLHDGWSARIFAPAASAQITSDSHALVVLIGGVLVSLLLRGCVLLLGRPRESRPAPKPRAVPNEDLYDPLTGLPNRALTLDRAERMVARTGRQSDMLAGALFVDIDWFQDITAKLGESAGEQLLRTVAERLE